MFSKQERLIKRTPKDGVDRKQFLLSLVEEFLQTKSFDAKSQVLANLSNFAYDPINYTFLREAGALDLLLQQLSPSAGKTFNHYACSGICNLCLDPINADYIIENDGINLLTDLLSSNNEETVLDAITSLLFLSDRDLTGKTRSPEITGHITELKKSENPRFCNLANLYSEDILSKTIYVKIPNKTVELTNIPLPK